MYFEYRILTIYLLGSFQLLLEFWDLKPINTTAEGRGGGLERVLTITLLAYFHIKKKSPLTSLLKPAADITPYRSQSNRWMFNAIQDILLQ